MRIEIHNRCNLDLLNSIDSNTIDMIYCDVLFGTGKNFGEYIDLDGKNRDVITEHYLPRFEEMFRVLKSTGSIYIHCDFRITHWLRCILDSVFGVENFRNTCVWLYGAGGGRGKQHFRRTHDDIHFYTKTSDYIFNPQLNNYGSSQQDWLQIKSIADKSGIFKIDNEVLLYPTQKPIDLISKFILSSSNIGDTVADFYLGSGTTAVCCAHLDRNFIGCDISSTAVEITKKRCEDLLNQNNKYGDIIVCE